MKNDLIERYIYAVTKGLPKKIREDVEKELRTLIDDMLEERCKDVSPTEKDVKVVLTELGTHNELSQKYNPDSGKQLIGGAYFPAYKMILTIVLISIAGGLLIASILGAFVGEKVWYEALLSWFGSLFGSLAAGFTIVTVIFAVFERKGVAVKLSSDSLDELPPVPEKNQVIKKIDPIIGIFISVLFAVYLLAMPGIFFYSFNGVEYGYLFEPEYVRSLWYLIIAMAVVGIIKESFRLYEGRITKKLAISTAVCNVLSGIMVCLFFYSDKLINPEFGNFINGLLEEDIPFINNMFSHFNIFLIIVILFGLVLDTIVIAVKSFRYDK